MQSIQHQKSTEIFIRNIAVIEIGHQISDKVKRRQVSIKQEAPSRLLRG